MSRYEPSDNVVDDDAHGEDDYRQFTTPVTVTVHDAHVVSQTGPGASNSFATCPTCDWGGPTRFTRAEAQVDADAHNAACGHQNTDFADRYFNQPCRLPVGHDYGHWYAPLVKTPDQEVAG